MATSKVSIGIPVYNRVNLIEETINSALNQSYKNIEIIVCDNYSTDGTWELLQKIVKKDTRIRIFRNEQNLGAVKNWIEVYKNASGDFFHMLWSDDIILPNFIESALDKFEANVAFVMVGCQEFNSNGMGFASNYLFESISTNDFIKDIVLSNKNNFLPSPTIALFRKVDLQNSILDIIPNNDNIDFNRTGAGPDVLFFLFTAFKYEKINIINEIMVLNRSHEDSITTIENKKNGLKLNYDWAKYYFIKNYYPQLLLRYKLVSLYRLFKYNFKHKNLVLDFLINK